MYTYILIYKWKTCRTKVLWVLEFGEVGDINSRKPKSHIIDDYLNIVFELHDYEL